MKRLGSEEHPGQQRLKARLRAQRLETRIRFQPQQCRRAQLEGILEALESHIDLAKAGMNQSPRRKKPGLIRRSLAKQSLVTARLIELAAPGVAVTQGSKHARRIGGYSHGAAETGEGLLVFAFGFPGECELPVRLAKPCVEIERSRELADSFIEAAGQIQRAAEVGVRTQKKRIQFQSRAETFRGFFQPSSWNQIGDRVQVVRGPGYSLNQPPESALRFGPLPVGDCQVRRVDGLGLRQISVQLERFQNGAFGSRRVHFRRDTPESEDVVRLADAEPGASVAAVAFKRLLEQGEALLDLLDGPFMEAVAAFQIQAMRFRIGRDENGGALGELVRETPGHRPADLILYREDVAPLASHVSDQRCDPLATSMS